MTEPMKCLPQDASDWTIPDDTAPMGKDGLKRRTILLGAAWSVPVISAAIAAPLAAASTAAGALAFNAPTYPGTPCSSITGAYVTATQSGAPIAGESVTVTLTDGYTFADGSTTYTGVSGANGQVALPTIEVPAIGGDAVFTAAGAGVSTTSIGTAPTATATVYGRALIDNSNGVTFNSPAPAPAGSAVVGWDTYITPSGDLYKGTLLIASGVTGATAEYDDNGGLTRITYSTASSVSAAAVDNGGVVLFNAVRPNSVAGSTEVGWDTYITPSGTLYRGGVLIASGVTSASAEYDPVAGGTRITYINASGSADAFVNNAGEIVFNNVVASHPADTRVVGWDTFLTPSGDLYKRNVLVATGVLTAGAEYDDNVAVTRLTYTTASGLHVANVNNSGGIDFNVLRSTTAGATAVGWDSWLTSSGDLYKNGVLVAQNVTSAVAEYDPIAGGTRLTYGTAPAC